MRQPEHIHLNPSQSYPWYGSWVTGDRLTRGQRSALRLSRLDPDAVEIVTVQRRATHREMWWPSGQPAPVFTFDCPVIARLRDGRLRIITPSGDAAIIQGDGWTTPAESAAAAAAARRQSGKDAA